MKSLLGIAFVLLALSGASLAETRQADIPPGSGFVATIPPIADILSSIAGERASASWLLPAGASPHTHEPRPSDIRGVEKALVFFYVDRLLDGWAASIPAKRKVHILSLVPDSLLLDFPAEGEEDAGEREDHSHEPTPGTHDHSFGTDPHFWTDPIAVRAVVPRLAEKMIEADPEGEEVYLANARALEARLDSLHVEIERRIAPVRGRRVVLSHPFLCYFLHRYGIPLAGVIEIVEGKEPTAKDLARAIREAPRRNASMIVALPQLSRRAADLVAESTGLSVRVIDPLGGVPGKETYEELLFAIADGIAGEGR
ncbi:MAG: zinc ABC transporter substrate-binding protein [Candidatus Eisenbacteria bacterium]|nr:zinc ABC transporter substrate-binding protein [Candidatus Eisenbacteria bacterium]